MPTLFRLLLVAALLWAGGYGALYAIANALTPAPRTIEQAVALPQGASDVRTGRSAAAMLDRQAAALVRHRRHPR